MSQPMIASPQSDRAASLDGRRVLPFGALAFVGAVGSLLTCYGSLFVSSIFGVETLGIHPDIQAAVMWGFGLVALVALWFDRRHHARNLPLLIGAVGLGVLLFGLYVHYDVHGEILAYVMLVVAALLNQTAMVRALNSTVVRQAKEIQDFNQHLEDKVQRQVKEIECLSRLKDFLAPSVAEIVINEDRESLLESHRRYIACMFCDIRNFTIFSKSLEPEEIIEILQVFHEELGRLIAERNGTINHRAGDGLMVFFNDPIPCETPVLDAVMLALDIQDAWPQLRKRWQRLGQDVGIGVAITSGHATIGLVGNQGNSDYTAIGNCVNLAARLCDQAQEGEVLIDKRAYLDVENVIEAEECETRELKGIGSSVESYRVVGLKATSSGD